MLFKIVLEFNKSCQLPIKYLNNLHCSTVWVWFLIEVSYAHMHLFVQKYNKNSNIAILVVNIVKYYYNLK